MWLALATVVALIGIAGTLIISILGNSIHSFSTQLPEYQSRLQGEINQFFAWLSGHGINWYDTELRQYINPNTALGFVGKIFNGLGSLLANSFLIFLTVMFLLFEGVALKDKMLTIYGDAAEQQIDLQPVGHANGNADLDIVGRALHSDPHPVPGSGVILGALAGLVPALHAARLDPVWLYHPPTWLTHVALLAMVPSESCCRQQWAPC